MPFAPHSRGLQGAGQEDEQESDLGDEQFERELVAMAGYGSAEEEEAEGGFAALRRRLQQTGKAGGGGEEEEEGGEEGHTGMMAAAAAAAREEVQRLLEEYYQLDCEGHVAGMPTRFRCGGRAGRELRAPLARCCFLGN